MQIERFGERARPTEGINTCSHIGSFADHKQFSNG